MGDAGRAGAWQPVRRPGRTTAGHGGPGGPGARGSHAERRLLPSKVSVPRGLLPVAECEATPQLSRPFRSNGHLRADGSTPGARPVGAAPLPLEAGWPGPSRSRMQPKARLGSGHPGGFTYESGAWPEGLQRPGLPASPSPSLSPCPRRHLRPWTGWLDPQRAEGKASSRAWVSHCTMTATFCCHGKAWLQRGRPGRGGGPHGVWGAAQPSGPGGAGDIFAESPTGPGTAEEASEGEGTQTSSSSCVLSVYFIPDTKSSSMCIDTYFPGFNLYKSQQTKRIQRSGARLCR